MCTKYSYLFHRAVLFILFNVGIASGQNVNVGGYEFPPFLEHVKGGYVGITVDLIEMMNSFQDKFSFRLVPTSSKRRYKDFDKGLYDMIFFENRNWGWTKKPVVASRVYLRGGEVYIAKVRPGRNDTYFDDFQGKTILGYLGYHYGFAGFETDELLLKNKYNAFMTNSHERNIFLVINEHFDIAVITKSYLSKYLYTHPQLKKELIISKKMDQEYNHTIIIRNEYNPGKDEMDRLLDNMENAGILKILWNKYGLE